MAAKPKSQGGRPTTYTQETADTICSRLADGLSLRTICSADDMPEKATVFKWLRSQPEFVDQYTRAREQSTIAHFEDMFDIADQDPLEPIYDKEGLPVFIDGKAMKAANKASIDHARLRIETRKWALSKILPKKYSDRTVLDATINDYTAMSPEDRKRRLMELQQQIANADRPS